MFNQFISGNKLNLFSHMDSAEKFWKDAQSIYLSKFA